jgi:hypothetical protein
MAPDTGEDEADGLTDLLALVGEVEHRLQAALGRLEQLVRATAEPPLMPNYERAGDQLRTALRSTMGAAKALRRRLQIARQRDARRR